MSNLHQIFPVDHPVFSGGRYLRAFDHLHDIDHYEHSILTYLGSLMPFKKGFLDHPAPLYGLENSRIIARGRQGRTFGWVGKYKKW